jgi:hypothetical protein
VWRSGLKIELPFARISDSFGSFSSSLSYFICYFSMFSYILLVFYFYLLLSWSIRVLLLDGY